ncbi:hypothetical protein ABW20_dc0100463 [Dactylellina cionopaga]|nr:hypothetical protein ABW20_dc0100463 [Dactylellina cionopaga]
MPLSVALQDDTIVVDGRLGITFRRTIRVPDNDQISNLPPDMGKMSLINVSGIASRLPGAMAVKGGLMVTMHGGINVVSGEPENENTATTLRRRALVAKGDLIQDYVVVPGQRWLDGIAVAGGKVRQFVAAPLGSGLTIEGQLTNEELVGGLQFEIIATKRLSTLVPSTMHLVLALSGGGPELGIAAGGMIKQSILPDHIPKSGRFQWVKDDILVFNVQMLDAIDYTRIIDGPKQAKPVSAQDYAASGGQFFDLKEGESSIYGDFGGVKSVGQLTGKLDTQLQIGSKKIGSPSKKDNSKNPTKSYEVAAKIPSYTYTETSSASGASPVHTENSTQLYGSIENSAIGGTSYTESAASTPAHHSNEITSLTTMGFTRNQATKALRITSGNLERAVEWILDHLDDPGEAESIPKKQISTVKPPQALGLPDTSLAIVTLQPRKQPFRTLKDLEESMKRVNIGTF